MIDSTLAQHCTSPSCTASHIWEVAEFLVERQLEQALHEGVLAVRIGRQRMPVETQHRGEARDAGIDERADLASRRSPAGARGASACVSCIKAVSLHSTFTGAPHEFAGTQSPKQARWCPNLASPSAYRLT